MTVEQKIDKLLEEAQKSFKNVPCDGIKKKLGFSCGQDAKGYFIYTHRARSKSYPSLKDIPMKDIEFIDGTS
jgi:hypothetical protein